MIINFMTKRQKDIADFLKTNIELRVLFMDPNADHTCHDILVDLLMLWPYADRPDVKKVFNMLAEAGELAYYQCGTNDEGEALYRVRQDKVDELREYFP